MKKAMKQSTLTFILHAVTVLMNALLLVLAHPVLQRQFDALENRYEVTQTSGRLLHASWYLTKQVRAYANSGDAVYVQRYEQEFGANRNREIAMDLLRRLLEDEEERGLVEEMGRISDALIAQDREAFRQIETQGDRDQALRIVYGSNYQELADRITELQAEFSDRVEARTEEIIAGLEKDKRNVVAVLAGWLIVACALQIAAPLLSRNHVIRPLQRAEKEMNRLAQGDLSSPV